MTQHRRPVAIPVGWPRAVVLAGALVCCALESSSAQCWTHYAGNPQRDAITSRAPQSLSALLWVAAEYPPGAPIRFEGPSGPVVFNGRLYANARHYVGGSHVQNKIVALDMQSGAVQFETLIDKSVMDSWSSPAVDEARGTILIGSGSRLFAINAASGGVVWSRLLSRPVVNASAVVAAGVGPGRAFITDFDGFGSGASLYCINTSPYDAATNPYQPGEIVWQEPIGGSSGNSPACADGLVYVASTTGFQSGCEESGHLYAFSIFAPAGSRLRWSKCIHSGFFGGVCVKGGFVYAASYNFDGTGDNSTLVKLRADDGSIVWTIPCARTDSVPVVAGDRIYLSTGLQGYGSVPAVQAFLDQGVSATRLWDTYQDSAGLLIVGGWSHQPVYADGRLFVGKIPLTGNLTAPYTDLYILDTARGPWDPDFVSDHRSGVGSSPAICAGRLYSIGPAGLQALASKGDFCGGEGVVDGLDIQCFIEALMSSPPTSSQIALGDFDSNGVLDAADITGFTAALLEPD